MAFFDAGHLIEQRGSRLRTSLGLLQNATRYSLKAFERLHPALAPNALVAVHDTGLHAQPARRISSCCAEPKVGWWIGEQGLRKDLSLEKEDLGKLRVIARSGRPDQFIWDACMCHQRNQSVASLM